MCDLSMARVEPDRHVVMQLIFFTATNFFLTEAANERQVPPLTDRKEGGKPAIPPGSVLLWCIDINRRRRHFVKFR